MANNAKIRKTNKVKSTRKPLRSNGIKPYAYHVNDIEDPIPENMEDWDGIYREAGRGEVVPDNYIRDDGVTLKQVLYYAGFPKVAAKTFDEPIYLAIELRKRIETPFVVHKYTGIEDAIIIAYSKDDLDTYVSAFEKDRKGYKIAVEYVSNETGVRDCVKTTESKVPSSANVIMYGYGTIPKNDYLTTPSDQRMYHVLYRDDNGVTDFGIQTEMTLIYNHVISDSLIDFPRPISKTFTGTYYLLRVVSPPTNKSGIVLDEFKPIFSIMKITLDIPDKAVANAILSANGWDIKDIHEVVDDRIADGGFGPGTPKEKAELVLDFLYQTYEEDSTAKEYVDEIYDSIVGDVDLAGLLYEAILDKFLDELGVEGIQAYVERRQEYKDLVSWTADYISETEGVRSDNLKHKSVKDKETTKRGKRNVSRTPSKRRTSKPAKGTPAKGKGRR